MGLHRHVLRVLLSGLILVGLAWPAAAQLGRVNGIVRGEDGEPLKGATVTADNSNVGQSFTATTDSKGRFVMLGLRSGDWRFVGQAPGHSPQALAMVVRVGGPNPPVIFTLENNGIPKFGALAGIDGKRLQADLSAADVLLSQSRWDDAVGAYRDLLEKAPVIVSINLQLAQAYRGKKDYDGAMRAYEALLTADPGNAKAHLGIASTRMELGDAKGAEDALLKAAEGPAATREVYYGIGELRFSRSEFGEAAQWYERASAADPAWGKPLYKLGLCAMRLGDDARAMSVMNQVVAVDPMSPEAGMARSSIESLRK